MKDTTCTAVRRRESQTYFFLSLSFLNGCEQPWRACPISVSAATFLLLKAFISSSSSRLFSSRFFFSSWCMRFSCSNLSWSYRKTGRSETNQTQYGLWNRVTMREALTSFSFSLSSASVSLTLLTNICLISSSLRCRSTRNSFRLASYVSWRLRIGVKAGLSPAWCPVWTGLMSRGCPWEQTSVQSCHMNNTLDGDECSIELTWVGPQA